MSPQIARSVSRVARSLLSSASKSSNLLAEGRSVAATAAVVVRARASYRNFGRRDSSTGYSGWLSSALALPAAGMEDISLVSLIYGESCLTSFVADH